MQQKTLHITEEREEIDIDYHIDSNNLCTESQHYDVKGLCFSIRDAKAYLAGAGVVSLAAAVYLIRYGYFPGKNIHIFKDMIITGENCDGTISMEKELHPHILSYLGTSCIYLAYNRVSHKAEHEKGGILMGFGGFGGTGRGSGIFFIVIVIILLFFCCGNDDFSSSC